jgi:threonine-phosphate decarboxylase
MNTSDLGHGGNIQYARSRYGLDYILDFSSNVNPLGLPKGFFPAVRPALNEIVHYPEISYHPITKILPSSLGVHPNRILLGNGSTELLYLLPLALKPKRCIICSPAYADYERSFNRAGIPIDFFPAKEKNNFQWDLNKLKIAKDDMVVIGNPNNPTSVHTPKEKILDLVLSYPKNYFLVDEAFIDFLPGSASLIGNNMPPNLLVLRSLTKFYAIPGLRLGCLAASTEIIERLSIFQEPWTVNCLAAQAGVQEKEFLFQELAAISGLKPFPPAVNFILVKITRKNLSSTSLTDKMARKGILIRDCANFKGLSEEYFRVSINPRKENKLLLVSLKKALGDQT